MSSQVRLFLGTAALVAAYFGVPVSFDGNVVMRGLVTIALLAVATVLIVRQVRHQVRQEGSALWVLALAVIGSVLTFALADYIIAFSRPGEFEGLDTRLDALYFALTTLATVGYGDVHAQGQIARAVVSIQLMFNILVLTTAASIFMTQLRARAKH